MVLDSMKTSYGMTELRGNARIYDSKEAKEKTERSYLVTRGMPKQKEEA
mgnify:FL=1